MADNLPRPTPRHSMIVNLSVVGMVTSEGRRVVRLYRMTEHRLVAEAAAGSIVWSSKRAKWVCVREDGELAGECDSEDVAMATIALDAIRAGVFDRQPVSAPPDGTAN